MDFIDWLFDKKLKEKITVPQAVFGVGCFLTGMSFTYKLIGIPIGVLTAILGLWLMNE